MKVYFNNSCKICKTEIDLYKKEKIQEIDWVDITNNNLAEKETSKNSKQLLRRLHVKEGEKITQGAEAFLLLWKKMPKYNFLYKFFKYRKKAIISYPKENKLKIIGSLKKLYKNLYLGIFFQTIKKASAPSKTFSPSFT